MLALRMVHRHPWLALVSVAILIAGALALAEPNWLRYRDVGEEVRRVGMSVWVDSLPPYYYGADYTILTERKGVTWAGDTVDISFGIGHGSSSPSLVGCDTSVVRVSDRALVPIRAGRTNCLVRAAALVAGEPDLLDTLRLAVQGKGGTLVINTAGPYPLRGPRAPPRRRAAGAPDP